MYLVPRRIFQRLARKLTEGNVTIARDGEWYEISFDGLTLAGSDQTSLTGSYEGRVQYIDARE